MTDTLRERVARALWEAQCEHWQPYRAKLEAAGKLCDYLMLSDGRQRELMSEADAAIDLIRAEVLEEAAKELDRQLREFVLSMAVRREIGDERAVRAVMDCAAAIRALKEDGDA